MPTRNIVKQYDVDAFYHVYNRGAGEQKIFVDSADKKKFMELFRRHLLEEPGAEENKKYDAEMVAYCLMSNHFHLLLWQGNDLSAISGLMRSVSTAYSMYFNKRHKRQGHVFQSVFRASRITDESYLAHISRYIHLNPERYRNHYWSSLKEYLGERSDDLLHPERVLDMPPEQYAKFLEEYTDRRELLKSIREHLANR